jgi:hypothetical protein
MTGVSTIKSGDSGNVATVNNNNQLLTKAVSEELALEASTNGDAYSMSTGIITLTSDSMSWLSYIKNTDTVSWFVEAMLIIIGPSTGGSGTAKVGFNVGASTGTLISAGTAGTPGNINFGNPKPLAADFLKGVEGSTITNGGTSNILIHETPIAREITSQLIIIPPGTTVSLGVQPPTGNTSVEASIATVIYRGDE